MKVQSKKDSFFVDTKRDSKKVIQVSDYYDAERGYSAEWQYVIIKGGFISDVDDNYYDQELPVISFEEWQSLPDIPKPEYDFKDVAVALKGWTSNDRKTTFDFEENSITFPKPNKIIGYKLIKPEYKEAAKLIALIHMGEQIKYYTGNFEKIGVKNGAPCKKSLEEAGVLSLWFEPVYDTSITLKSGVKLSEDDIAEVKELIKIRQVCKDLAK